MSAAKGGWGRRARGKAASAQVPEPTRKAPSYMDWFADNGFDVRDPENINEGEGDFLLVGDVILAGTGFRSASNSHEELGQIFRREVVTLKPVNPRFYHLGTAIAKLDDTTIAYPASACG